ncbi:hypothetical protein [Streptomyces sp. TRM49041]|uniref:hypothetical protein n=1 Tax=Streptomyces sp. TRM49041 TaxID=2603216 RepID=UPI0011EDC91B|nr:hypothetical protein [Streptomyces sp. TRM49041]
MSDPDIPTPEEFGYDPADFGADKIKVTPIGHNAYHWTAYSNSGGQISWNTDHAGNYIDYSPDPRYGPEVHMSDRNIKGRGKTVWKLDDTPNDVQGEDS